MFLFRLCLALGYVHPDYLLKVMTARQLNEWFAYADIEPFGEQREELRHGQQMALTANINRNTKNKPDPFAPIDFMNFIELEPEKELSPEEISNIFSNMFGV